MKRKVIDSDEYLNKIVCYIHHNPVHHGLTLEMVHWPYSSHKSIISGESNGMDMPDEQILAWFGGIENFIFCHTESLSIKLNSALAIE